MAVASRTAGNIGVHVFLLNDYFLGIPTWVQGYLILGLALLRGVFVFFFLHVEAVLSSGLNMWGYLTCWLFPAFIVCRLVKMASLIGGI